MEVSNLNNSGASPQTATNPWAVAKSNQVSGSSPGVNQVPAMQPGNDSGMQQGQGSAGPAMGSTSFDGNYSQPFGTHPIAVAKQLQAQELNQNQVQQPVEYQPVQPYVEHQQRTELPEDQKIDVTPECFEAMKKLLTDELGVTRPYIDWCDKCCMIDEVAGNVRLLKEVIGGDALYQDLLIDGMI